MSMVDNAVVCLCLAFIAKPEILKSTRMDSERTSSGIDARIF